ncbi:MAG: hypothetical protein EOM06_12430 [Sphingobacteriia bacterium]|nr:hypothetical protein [Sphingobacteriia bacterium]
MKNLTVLFLSCLCWLGANATSWRINSNPSVSADFATFQEAHDAASPGDTIYVEGAGYDYHYGEVVIDKRLIVIGPGYFLLENDSTQAHKVSARFRSITINPPAAGTELYGLTIYWGTSGYKGITINASNVVIARNYFESSWDRIYFGEYNIQNIAIMQNFGQSITGASGFSADNVIITNNYFNSFIEDVSSGVITNNVVKNKITASYSQIINNILPNSTLYPLSGSDYGMQNYVAYNLVSGSLPPNPPGPGNVSNVDMNFVFIDFNGNLDYSTDGKWQLDPDGPAAGAGEEGVDCGMFGGLTPYVLSGLPPVPRIYEANVPLSGSSVSGLPVTIKVKSQN